MPFAFLLSINGKESIMLRKKCKHLKVSFLGMQETHIADKHLALYNCEQCRTTISVPVINVRNMNSKTAGSKTVLANG